MSSLHVSNRMLDKWLRPRDSATSFSLGAPSTLKLADTVDAAWPHADPFDAGIRALYGQLCTCVTHSGGRLRSVGITSCFENEEKSSIVEHLSAVAAESGRVLSINAQDSRVRVHRGMQEISRYRIERGRDAKISGTVRQATTEISSPTTAHPTIAETRDLLHRLCEEFDLVIVDLPPLDSAGALEWAPLVDGTVLVVEAERVRWQMAARRIALLEQAGGNVLGTVINKRRDHIPQWLYHWL
jgi:Mrp family chromosome partitioning ATPase